MNRLASAVIVAAAFGTFAGAWAQCDDNFDKVLCVYTLSGSEEAQFSSTDGQVSAFWANWSAKDQAELTYPDNCYPDRCGFTGADDASMIIRAAGTARGIYLYLAVQDNIWVDRADARDIGADATDMFLDKLSGEELFACTDCKIGLYGSLLSYTTNQFQVWMGAGAPPTGFLLQYYDETAWSWQELGMEFAAAKVLKGFEAEVVNVDATHKTQEWYFPWEKVGTTGIALGTAIAGTKLGFAGGYNDKDGDNPENHCLRWTIKDPWVGDANYWGDLLIASDMPPVGQGMAVKPSARSVQVRANAKGAQYFTLSGQRVTQSSVAAMPAGALVVKRTTGVSGAVRSEMVRTGR